MNYSIIKNSKNKIVNLKICDDIFSVEIVETEDAKRKGLSKRENLGEKEGMLFIFDKPDIRHFWMKDMNFFLDIIWINDDKIVGISENLELDRNSENPIIYSSSLPADKVLEINAGIFEKIRITATDINNNCGSKIEILSL